MAAHGNCDVTNCIGTPDDRVNLSATWERETWCVTATANYRGKMVFKNDADGCATHFADGTDAPRGCKPASFTTVDLTARWKVSRRWK